MACDRESRSTQVAAQAAVYALISGLIACFSTSTAAQLEIKVIDRTGNPVSQVVVTADDGNSASKPAEQRTMTMDQVNMRFVPEVLVVPVGANVVFPNSDSVSHQVYSFSSAKRFQLPLYKGKTQAPVSFDKPGLVVLGCNIHDQMVGYVYVTSAHWYGQTGDDGRIVWQDVNAPRVTLNVWSPLIADEARSLSRELDVAGNDGKPIEFRLSKTLRSQPEPRPRHADWDY